MLLLLLSLLAWCATSSIPTLLHPHLLKNLGLPCGTTAHCLAHQPAWCQSGVLCYRAQCHRVPDFPCPATQWCDERERRCFARNCSSWRDCDDGVFCNGAERCVAGRCLNDGARDCAGGICSERDKQCALPLAMRDARDRLLRLAQGAPPARVPSTGGGAGTPLNVLRNDYPTAVPSSRTTRAAPAPPVAARLVHSATAEPTAAPILNPPPISAAPTNATGAPTTPGGLTQWDVWWIVIAVVVILALGLVVLVVASANRHQAQTVIIDDRSQSSTPANSLYSTQYRYSARK